MKVACICQDCGTEIFVDVNMVKELRKQLKIGQKKILNKINFFLIFA